MKKNRKIKDCIIVICVQWTLVLISVGKKWKLDSIENQIYFIFGSNPFLPSFSIKIKKKNYENESVV